MKNLLIAISSVMIAATAAANDPFNLESIKLPAGYILKHGMGTDSHVAEIYNENGLTITSDTGAGAGEYVTPKRASEYLWIRKIQLGGQPAYLAMSKYDGLKHLMITFERIPVNFRSTVASDGDIAEFIAVLSTYRLPNR